MRGEDERESSDAAGRREQARRYLREAGGARSGAGGVVSGGRPGVSLVREGEGEGEGECVCVGLPPREMCGEEARRGQRVQRRGGREGVAVRLP